MSAAGANSAACFLQLWVVSLLLAKVPVEGRRAVYAHTPCATWNGQTWFLCFVVILMLPHICCCLAGRVQPAFAVPGLGLSKASAVSVSPT
jgi:hypothetical protein